MSEPVNMETFREEIRSFISEKLPVEMAERNRLGYHPSREDVQFWTRELEKKGWSVPNWPVEYGGPGWSVTQRHIFDEECFLAGAPALSPQGTYLVGPVIYSFGSPEQKEKFLPRIRSGEHLWAQGFSEPNAGSDLTSLKTRAERDKDEYIVNGQKIWTSEAHTSDWLFLLVRTDMAVKPQKGISFLLVDLKTPGITIRPIKSIDEDLLLNEVFLEDVRVSCENLVGEEGMGWTYAKSLLGEERTFSAEVPRCRYGLRRIRDIASQINNQGRKLLQDPDFARRIAELEGCLMAHEATVWRFIEEEEAGRDVSTAASILKIRGTELMQEIGALMVEALGDDAFPVFPAEEFRSRTPGELVTPSYAPGVVSDFMYRRAATIYGGTNEIQRNLIARMLLRD